MPPPAMIGLEMASGAEIRSSALMVSAPFFCDVAMVEGALEGAPTCLAQGPRAEG